MILLGIEFVLKGLNKDIDPVEHYRVLSEKYLTEARELLKKGDLVQALEKFWGAPALAVKSIGEKRGLKLEEEHGGLWSFVNVLAMQSGDKAYYIFSCSK